MNRILVVANPSDRGMKLLREAGEIASRMGVDLVVFAYVVEERDTEKAEKMRDLLAEDPTLREPADDLELVRTYATHVAKQTLADIDVTVATTGDVVEINRPSERVIEVAESHNCDHVFMTATRRSPTGKAIFGDVAQSVILSFDGFVTVSTE